MVTLDYKSPEVRRRSVWPRRYVIFVPIVGICYVIGVVCVFLQPSYALEGPAVPIAFTISRDFFGYVIGFPLLDFIFSFSLATVLGLVFCNAVISGFAVVGFFHAVSVIRARLGGGN
jgi:hypothetical protein